MDMKIKINSEGDLVINTREMLQSMSDEVKKEFIHDLSVDDVVLKRAVDYICDEDSDGWWSGNSANIRQELLTRVEKSHMKTCLYCHWSWLDEVKKQIKHYNTQFHIYWWIYHHSESYIGLVARNNLMDAMKKAGLTSQHTTEDRDGFIEDLMNTVKDALHSTLVKLENNQH